MQQLRKSTAANPPATAPPWAGKLLDELASWMFGIRIQESRIVKCFKLWAAVAAMFAVSLPATAQEGGNILDGGVPRTEFGQNVDNVRRAVQGGQDALRNLQQDVQGRVDSVRQAGQNLQQAVTGNRANVQSGANVAGANQAGVQGNAQTPIGGVQGNVQGYQGANQGTYQSSQQGNYNQGQLYNQGRVYSQGQPYNQGQLYGQPYTTQPYSTQRQVTNQGYRQSYGQTYSQPYYGSQAYSTNQGWNNQMMSQPSYQGSYYANNFSSTNRVYRLRYDAWGREFICVNGRPVYFDSPNNMQNSPANQGQSPSSPAQNPSEPNQPQAGQKAASGAQQQGEMRRAGYPPIDNQSPSDATGDNPALSQGDNQNLPGSQATSEAPVAPQQNSAAGANAASGQDGAGIGNAGDASEASTGELPPQTGELPET